MLSVLFEMVTVGETDKEVRAERGDNELCTDVQYILYCERWREALVLSGSSCMWEEMP